MTGRDRRVLQDRISNLRRECAAKGDGAATGYDLLVLAKIIDDVLIYVDNVDDKIDDLDQKVTDKTEAPVPA